MRSRLLMMLVVVAAGSINGGVASAQEPATVLVDAQAGRAWFADDSPIRRDVLGAGMRWYVSPRVAIGHEVTLMRGPGNERDFVVTGNASFDLVPSGHGRTIVPYVIAGGGYTRMRREVGTGLFTSSEGALTGGAGVRITSASGWYAAPEFRVGWELHSRVSVTVGWSR